MSYQSNIKAISTKLNLLCSCLHVARSLMRENKWCTDIFLTIFIFRQYDFAEQESNFNNTEGLKIFKFNRNT